MSWLNARSHLDEKYLLYCLYDNSTLLTIVPLRPYPVPFNLFGQYVLKSPIVELGSSIGIPERFREEAARALLDIPGIDKGRPLAVCFQRIDKTNPFLSVNSKHLITSAEYTRNVLSIKDFDHGNSISRWRKSLKHKYNKLNQMGTHSFEIIEEPDAIASMFDQFVQLESLGWKHGQKRAMHNNPFIYTFYRSLTMGFANECKAVIFNLKCNGRIIGSHICIHDSSTLYGLKITYDEEFSITSPGTLLLDYIFNHYCALHAIEYYNTMSDSSWFDKMFHPGKLNTYKLFLFRSSIMGTLMKTSFQLLNTIRFHRKCNLAVSK